ncbi:MAG: hypothetical protein M3Y72_05035 [Acidobacteriota bacterium]|nr:hypothetical protein [Acidobacteriota bacterium]
MKTRKYVVFSPPEIARWEISALFVERNVIWLALDHFGEDISTSPGGLVRWNRNDHNVRHYSLEFVVDKIRRDVNDSSRLVLRTRAGYALFLNGNLQRFRVEQSSNGKETIIPIKRFPPPPSHQ